MKPTTLPALFGALLAACASVVTAAPTAANASTLSCKPYIPFGPNYGEPTGNVEFTVRGPPNPFYFPRPHSRTTPPNPEPVTLPITYNPSPGFRPRRLGLPQQPHDDAGRLLQRVDLLRAHVQQLRAGAARLQRAQGLHGGERHQLPLLQLPADPQHQDGPLHDLGPVRPGQRHLLRALRPGARHHQPAVQGEEHELLRGVQQPGPPVPHLLRRQRPVYRELELRRRARRQDAEDRGGRVAGDGGAGVLYRDDEEVEGGGRRSIIMIITIIYVTCPNNRSAKS